MNPLQTRLSIMLDRLPREDRVPVMRACHLSDGSWLSFCSELEGQVWDFPDLDLEQVHAHLAFDLA